MIELAHPKPTQLTLNPQSVDVALLLLPGFTMVAAAGAIDALRLANRELGRTCYRWQLCSADGEAVIASNGLTLGPVVRLDQADRNEPSTTRERTPVATRAEIGLLLVCGGEGIELASTPALVGQVQRVAARCHAIGAMCTGAILLARAGLLDNCRAAVHWESLPGAREQFPNVSFGEEVFAIDGNRLTCAGGTGSLDLMLAMLAHQHGQPLAACVAELLVLPVVRDSGDPQLVPLYAHLGRFHAKLIEAATVMQANIAQPLPLDTVAQSAGISRRQLERLFKRHVGQVPTRYYLHMRLRRARQLLRQTGMSVMAISSACGFRSPPHFSKCFRAQFGYTPSAERRPRHAMIGPGKSILLPPDPIQVSQDLAQALAASPVGSDT